MDAWIWQADGCMMHGYRRMMAEWMDVPMRMHMSMKTCAHIVRCSHGFPVDVGAQDRGLSVL